MSGMVLVESTARFSDCRRYRYSLTRRFADGHTVAFIGLNPSTADEHADDPTIRRCIGFAKRWGYGELVMLNLYAWRSTDPRGLWAAGGRDVGVCPDGEILPGTFGLLDENLRAVRAECERAQLVVCAWGADPGPDADRPRRVLDELDCHLFGPVDAPTVALALTKHGRPRHPLYVRGDVTPIPYPPTTEDQ